MSFKHEEEIEKMEESYRAAIGNCMLSNFAHLVKLWNKDEITRNELLELDRKNMEIRRKLLNIVGVLNDKH